MFCPNCGTNNPDGSKFCSECGTVFESVKAPEADTPAPTVDEILGEIKSEPVAQPAPAEPEQPAPAEPEQPAPAEPEQPAPAEPEQPAPVELAKPAPVEPAQSVEPPAPQPIPEPPVAPSIPTPPVAPQMPQQPIPQYQQPVAPAVPKPPKPPRKPLDAKQKKLLIIGGSCGVVLVAFLIVLFAVIIPHSGLKGKLRYSWTRVDSTRSVNVLNLKKKSWTVGSKIYKITSWTAKGDRVQFNYTDGISLESETFVVAFSPDGKKVYFFDAYGYDDGDRPDYVFARGNYVQNNSLNDILW